MSKKVIFVKRRWPIWKKPKDAQWPMESVRWTRGICREDADLSVLVLGRWRVADEVKEGRRGFGLYENLDNSVVVFRVVYL